MDKKKLLIVGQTPPPWHGQAVATKMLIDHEWPNWEIDSVRMAYSEGIDEVGKFQWKKISHLFALTREVRRKLKANPEMVMLYPPASASWLPFIRDIYFLMRTRSLARGTAFIFHASGLPAYVRQSKIRSWLAKLAYKNADISLEVAQETITAKEVFEARASLWCPCAAEVPERASEGIRRSDCFTVLYVGSLMEGKGIMEILRTAKTLKDRGLNKLRFSIVGKWSDHEFQNECETFVAAHHLSDWVDFCGQLTGDAKWQAFFSSDLFFFPSHYRSEASPIVLMEALGAGLPIVSTRWAGIPAMVGDCEVVTLCDVQSPEQFADAIQAYRQEPKDSTSASQRAIEFFQGRFTPARFISRIEQGLSKAGL